MIMKRMANLAPRGILLFAPVFQKKRHLLQICTNLTTNATGALLRAPLVYYVGFVMSVIPAISPPRPCCLRLIH